jgi:hypothetical protein
MPLLDMAEIIRTARELRDRAALPGPPYSARDLMVTCFPDVLVTGAQLPTGLTELVEAGPRGKVIFYNRKSHPSTHRVGIIHGLGHLLFDLVGDIVGTEAANKRCALSFGPHQASQPAAERRADLFAGEILVPLEDLDKMITIELFPTDKIERQHFDDTVDNLASKFNVPVGFLRFRLWDLLQFRRSNFFIKP